MRLDYTLARAELFFLVSSISSEEIELNLSSFFALKAGVEVSADQSFHVFVNGFSTTSAHLVLEIWVLLPLQFELMLELYVRWNFIWNLLSSEDSLFEPLSLDFIYLDFCEVDFEELKDDGTLFKISPWADQICFVDAIGGSNSFLL